MLKSRALIGGVTAWVAALAFVPPSASAANRVYWGNGAGSTLSFANLDNTGGGGQLNTTGATVSNPRGVAIDPATNKIYWANLGNNTIGFANLDNTGAAGQLNTTGATLSFPDGVAIDPAANKIYWANGTNNTISFANLDDTGGGGQLKTTGATLSGPVGVAIDPAANKIYWANSGNNTISFANLDNTGGGGQLKTTGVLVNAPLGVAVDPAARKVYWANTGDGTIDFANEDNTGGGGQLNTTGATTGSNTFPALLEVPAAAGVPVVSGGSTPGSSLSCSAGSWAPDLLGSFLFRTPRSFAFSWTLNGASIPGATSSTLTATTPGSYACRVTAANFAGSAAQTSAVHPVTALTITSLKAKINHKKHTAKFTFKGSAGTTGFQCALIKIKKHGKKNQKPHFTACKSPKVFKHLKKGKYKFQVRALSAFGNGPPKAKIFRI